MSTHCAQIFDHLATYLFTHREGRREAEAATVARLRAHVGASPGLFPDLVSRLFEQLLFGPYANHWAVTRPVLSTLLADEAAFAGYRAHLVGTQVTPQTRKRTWPPRSALLGRPHTFFFNFLMSRRENKEKRHSPISYKEHTE